MTLIGNVASGESLSVNVTGTPLQTTFTNGVLSITGEATADVYQNVLASIAYTYPDALLGSTSRIVEVSVSDGTNISAPVTATVDFNTTTSITPPVGYTCIDWQAGAQGWLDVSAVPKIVWDANGMYAVDSSSPARAMFALPTSSNAWNVTIISNERAAFNLIAGASSDALTTTLTPLPDGTYFIAQPFIGLTWLPNDDVQVDSAAIFYAFCYRPVPAFDLTVTALDTAGLQIDFDTLVVAGTLTATIANPSAAISEPFDVLFFEDLNANDAYDAGIDLMLGQTTQAGLAAGASAIVSITPSGQMRFVGDVVHVLVDSADTIREVNETNNVFFAQCAAPTPTP